MAIPPPVLDSDHALCVYPGVSLSGTVTVGGSTNAALSLLGTAAAMGRPVRLQNLPSSLDATIMLGLLADRGVAEFLRGHDPATVEVRPVGMVPAHRELAEAATIRASCYLVPGSAAAS